MENNINGKPELNIKNRSSFAVDKRKIEKLKQEKKGMQSVKKNNTVKTEK